MPTCRQWAGFRFAVSNDAAHQQIWIVERRSIRMSNGVTEFAAFVNRSRRFRGNVTGNTAGKRKLFEEMLQAFFVLRDMRIDFAVSSFQIGVGDQAWPAVARTRDIDHVEVVFLDQAIQMDINEIQSGSCSPVPEQAGLDVLQLQRFVQQGIGKKIDLPNGKV